MASLVGESSPAATFAATKDSEETILALLLQEGMPNKTTTASLGPVGKTIDDKVCIPLVTAAGTEGVGIHAESIEKKTLLL